MLNVWNAKFFCRIHMTFKSTKNIELLVIIYVFWLVRHFALAPLWESFWDMPPAQSTCSVRRSCSSLYASENTIWKRFSPTLFLATDQENVITLLYLFIYCGGNVCECMRVCAQACMCVCVCVCVGEWYVIVYVCVLSRKDISISSEY